MDFQNQYLNYDEYRTLGGEEIQDITSFYLLEYRAEKEIDNLSSNRFHQLKPEDYPKELKICVYELMSIINKYDDSDSDIVNEKVGEYNITRESKENREKNKVNDINKIVKQNLLNVKVNGVNSLYKGVDCNGN